MTSRSWIWVLAACFVWTGLTSGAQAAGSPIAKAMGNLRWGMSEREVVRFAKRQIEARYEAEMKKANPSKQAKLRDEMKRAQAEVEKSRVDFTGSRSRWDSSPVAGEFNYGEGESMIVAEGDKGKNYYFFRDGQLWKWYKAVDASEVNGGFKKFSSSVQGTFGKGRAKKGEPNPNQGEMQWIEYLDRNSRMRATDNSKRGVYALIFEDMAVVRELASLRPSKPSRLAGVDETEEAPAKKAKPAKSDDTEIARAQTRRSIFGNDRREESEAEYQARRERERAEARERQARVHQRQQDKKKGEVLKQLDGLDDSDPLGGL